ncbi:MAG TPA: hypothetical protein VGE51_06870 [Fontimonas sp.]
MKLMVPMFLALAATLGACAAPSPAPGEPAPPVAGETRYENMAAATAAAKDEDLICRNEEVLGSRFRQKVCKTRAQREQEAKQSKDELERANSRGAPISSR